MHFQTAENQRKKKKGLNPKEEIHIAYRGKMKQIMTEFSSETMETRRQYDNFKEMKESQVILYPDKTMSKNERQIDIKEKES